MPNDERPELEKLLELCARTDFSNENELHAWTERLLSALPKAIRKALALEQQLAEAQSEANDNWDFLGELDTILECPKASSSSARLVLEETARERMKERDQAREQLAGWHKAIGDLAPHASQTRSALAYAKRAIEKRDQLRELLLKIELCPACKCRFDRPLNKRVGNAKACKTCKDAIEALAPPSKEAQ